MQQPFLQRWNVWQVFTSWSVISDDKGEELNAFFFELSSYILAGQWYLTVHPADADGLKYGHKQQTHPTGSIWVEQLEDIHPSLIGQDKCYFSVSESNFVDSHSA